jgi:hypothetical protein
VREETRLLPERRTAHPLGLGPGPISTEELDVLGRVVKAIGDTEFVPKPLRGRPGAILAAILYGRSLGLDGMVALREVNVIDGTPSLSATAVLGRIRAAGHSVQIEQGTDHCIAHGVRADNGDEHTASFSLEDAKTANLLGKDNWRKYPRAMLRSRAVTELARALFSDVFAGMAVYAPEELGAVVDDAGQPVPSEQEDRANARNRHFALLAELEENEHTLTPEGYDSWEDYSKRKAQELLGVQSRAELDTEGWTRLTEIVDRESVPFG